MADPKPVPVPEARFTNVAFVQHTQLEFYLRFGQLVPDQPGVASLVGSLVMTPQHAKLLLAALSENIERYESRFGEIKPPPMPKPELMQ
ncbi:MAG TPA: DUF3467 domain-containing protein [Myxococcota bacterium]|nr:DUF3467 domain-containing protein [Myxococcota bacterium]